MENIKVKKIDIILMLIFAMFCVFLWFSNSIIDKFVGNNQEIKDAQDQYTKFSEYVSSIDKIQINSAIMRSPFIMNLLQLPNFPLDVNGNFIFGKLNPFVGGSLIYTSATATPRIISPAPTNALKPGATNR